MVKAKLTTQKVVGSNPTCPPVHLSFNWKPYTRVTPVKGLTDIFRIFFGYFSDIFIWLYHWNPKIKVSQETIQTKIIQAHTGADININWKIFNLHSKYKFDAILRSWLDSMGGTQCLTTSVIITSLIKAKQRAPPVYGGASGSILNQKTGIKSDDDDASAAQCGRYRRTVRADHGCPIRRS